MLTNAGGFTLYWFAPDTATRSNCSGSCTAYWPPLTGIPAAGPDVTGRLGTITRSDGATQATYNGHPLYTYIGDTRPGQANGNNLNLNGGLWHEVTAAGGPRSHLPKIATGGRLGLPLPRRSARLAAHRGQQAFEVLSARAARAQVRPHTRVALVHRSTGSGQLGVDVQYLHRLGASHIPRISAQEAVER